MRRDPIALARLLCCAALSVGGSAAANGVGSEATVAISVPEAEREGRPCAECHEPIADAFAGTRMAGAASGRDFLTEWATKGKPDGCLSCHAPSGGQGLGCADCHGSGGHPYPRVQVPDACARCHDAPGENTVRGFLEGPAPARGQDCLTCHLPDSSRAEDHRFQGPSTSGFLSGVARVRAFLRRARGGGTTAIIQVTHRAGHALPGGTTGRSVWLVMRGLRADGADAWRETARFGWEHHPDRGWLDRTLPAGKPALLEILQPDRRGAVRLRAELWYRFRAGPLEELDQRAVMLSSIELSLVWPKEEQGGRS